LAHLCKVVNPKEEGSVFDWLSVSREIEPLKRIRLFLWARNHPHFSVLVGSSPTCTNSSV